MAYCNKFNKNLKNDSFCAKNKTLEIPQSFTNCISNPIFNI